MKKNLLLSVLLGILSMGCSGEITPPKIEIAEDTQIQLNNQLIFPVDYGKLINQSLEGDARSLVQLIKLSKHTSGGGAYGFGVMLQTIALTIGDEKFAQAIEKLSAKELKNLHELLSAGFDYGDPQYKLDDFPLVLPRTYQITKNVQN